MKTIVIKNDFSEDHITRIAGEKLRFQILGADAKKEKIIIDFSGVCIASTSFFDEGFAKLTEAGWTLKDLEKQARAVFEKIQSTPASQSVNKRGRKTQRWTLI